MPLPAETTSHAGGSLLDSTPEVDAGWSGHNHTVFHRRHRLVATIDLDNPLRGIGYQRDEGCLGQDAASARAGDRRHQAAGDHAADRLLGLDMRSESRLSDHWVRGLDAMAVYEPLDARRLRATAMWRVLPPLAHETAWELVVSAQTSLEQSDSSLRVVADVNAQTLLWGRQIDGTTAGSNQSLVDATCVLMRSNQPVAEFAAALSVLVAVHPADLRRLRVEHRGDRALVECWLFSSTVEKGVLLRSRVLAAVGPSVGDTDWATPLADRFAASAPILSA